MTQQNKQTVNIITYSDSSFCLVCKWTI